VSCVDCRARLPRPFGSPASSADSALRIVKRLCSCPPRSADCDAGLLSAEEVLGDWASLPRSCWDSREVRPELPRDLAAAAGDACRRANAEVISLTPGCRWHACGTGTLPVDNRASEGAGDPATAGGCMLDGESLPHWELRITSWRR
jgi:hypothetical protein